MKDRQRRNFWMRSEIDMMLKLIKHFQTSHGCTSTTHNTFVQIANRMKKSGFHNKSALQIRRKWFQMKSAYLCYKRGNEERLLLIPAEFRSKIAQFVETESKYSNLRVHEIRTAEPSYVVETQPPEDSAIAHFANDMSKVKQHHSNASSLGGFSKKANATNASKTKNDDFKQQYAYCQEQLDKFLVHNMEYRKLLQTDIKQLQTKLNDYQQKCQMMREANIRDFLESYATSDFDLK